MKRLVFVLLQALATSLLISGCSAGPDGDGFSEEGSSTLYEEALAALPNYEPFYVEPGSLVIMHRGGAIVIPEDHRGTPSASWADAYRVVLPIPQTFTRSVWPYAGGWRVLTSVGLPRIGFVYDLFDLSFSGGQMVAMTGARPRPRAVYVDDMNGRFYTAMRTADDGAHELAVEVAEDGEAPCVGVIIAKFALGRRERTDTRCLGSVPSGAWLYTLWGTSDARTMVLKYREGAVHERPRLALFNVETGHDLGTLEVEGDLVTDGAFLNGDFYYFRQLSGIVSRLTPADPATGTPLRDEVVMEVGPYPPHSSIVRRLLFDDSAQVLRVVYTDATDTHIYTIAAGGAVSGVSIEGVVGRNAEINNDGNVVLREYNKTWEGHPGQPGYEPPSLEQLEERFFTVDPETGEVIDSLHVQLPAEAFWNSYFFVSP